MIEINQQIQQLLFATAYKMTGEIATSQDISQAYIGTWLPEPIISTATSLDYQLDLQSNQQQQQQTQ